MKDRQKHIEDGQKKKNTKKVVKRVSKKRSIPYGGIARAMLGAVAAAGIIGVALAAPNAFQIAKVFRGTARGRAKRYQAPAYVRKTVRSLERRGLVKIVVRKEEAKVYLTERGRQELLRYKLLEKRLERFRWDKKWRIIIFDIEEKRRLVRDRIRIDVRTFGFEKLQESVWVYPYECEDVVALLKANYGLDKELVYIVAGDIENDEWLRKRFKLKAS